MLEKGQVYRLVDKTRTPLYIYVVGLDFGRVTFYAVFGDRIQLNVVDRNDLERAIDKNQMEEARGYFATKVINKVVRYERTQITKVEYGALQTRIYNDKEYGTGRILYRDNEIVAVIFPDTVAKEPKLIRPRDEKLKLIDSTTIFDYSVIGGIILFHKEIDDYLWENLNIRPLAKIQQKMKDLQKDILNKWKRYELYEKIVPDNQKYTNALSEVLLEGKQATSLLVAAKMEDKKLNRNLFEQIIKINKEKRRRYEKQLGYEMVKHLEVGTALPEFKLRQIGKGEKTLIITEPGVPLGLSVKKGDPTTRIWGRLWGSTISSVTKDIAEATSYAEIYNKAVINNLEEQILKVYPNFYTKLQEKDTSPFKLIKRGIKYRDESIPLKSGDIVVVPTTKRIFETGKFLPAGAYRVDAYLKDNILEMRHLVLKPLAQTRRMVAEEIPFVVTTGSERAMKQFINRSMERIRDKTQINRIKTLFLTQQTPILINNAMSNFDEARALINWVTVATGTLSADRDMANIAVLKNLIKELPNAEIDLIKTRIGKEKGMFGDILSALETYVKENKMHVNDANIIWRDIYQGVMSRTGFNLIDNIEKINKSAAEKGMMRKLESFEQFFKLNRPVTAAGQHQITENILTMSPEAIENSLRRYLRKVLVEVYGIHRGLGADPSVFYDKRFAVEEVINALKAGGIFTGEEEIRSLLEKVAKTKRAYRLIRPIGARHIGKTTEEMVKYMLGFDIEVGDNIAAVEKFLDVPGKTKKVNKVIEDEIKKQRVFRSGRRAHALQQTVEAQAGASIEGAIEVSLKDFLLENLRKSEKLGVNQKISLLKLDVFEEIPLKHRIIVSKKGMEEARALKEEFDKYAANIKNFKSTNFLDSFTISGKYDILTEEGGRRIITEIKHLTHSVSQNEINTWISQANLYGLRVGADKIRIVTTGKKALGEVIERDVDLYMGIKDVNRWFEAFKEATETLFNKEKLLKLGGVAEKPLLISDIAEAIWYKLQTEPGAIPKTTEVAAPQLGDYLEMKGWEVFKPQIRKIEEQIKKIVSESELKGVNIVDEFHANPAPLLSDYITKKKGKIPSFADIDNIVSEKIKEVLRKDTGVVDPEKHIRRLGMILSAFKNAGLEAVYTPYMNPVDPYTLMKRKKGTFVDAIRIGFFDPNMMDVSEARDWLNASFKTKVHQPIGIFDLFIERSPGNYVLVGDIPRQVTIFDEKYISDYLKSFLNKAKISMTNLPGTKFLGLRPGDLQAGLIASIADELKEMVNRYDIDRVKATMGRILRMFEEPGIDLVSGVPRYVYTLEPLTPNLGGRSTIATYMNKYRSRDLEIILSQLEKVGYNIDTLTKKHFEYLQKYLPGAFTDPLSLSEMQSGGFTDFNIKSMYPLVTPTKSDVFRKETATIPIRREKIVKTLLRKSLSKDLKGVSAIPVMMSEVQKKLIEEAGISPERIYVNAIVLNDVTGETFKNMLKRQVGLSTHASQMIISENLADLFSYEATQTIRIPNVMLKDGTLEFHKGLQKAIEEWRKTQKPVKFEIKSGQVLGEIIDPVPERPYTTVDDVMPVEKMFKLDYDVIAELRNVVVGDNRTSITFSYTKTHHKEVLKLSTELGTKGTVSTAVPFKKLEKFYQTLRPNFRGEAAEVAPHAILFLNDPVQIFHGMMQKMMRNYRQRGESGEKILMDLFELHGIKPEIYRDFAANVYGAKGTFESPFVFDIKNLIKKPARDLSPEQLEIFLREQREIMSRNIFGIFYSGIVAEREGIEKIDDLRKLAAEVRSMLIANTGTSVEYGAAGIGHEGISRRIQEALEAKYIIKRGEGTPAFEVFLGLSQNQLAKEPQGPSKITINELRGLRQIERGYISKGIPGTYDAIKETIYLSGRDLEYFKILGFPFFGDELIDSPAYKEGIKHIDSTAFKNYLRRNTKEESIVDIINNKSVVLELPSSINLLELESESKGIASVTPRLHQVGVTKHIYLPLIQESSLPYKTEFDKLRNRVVSDIINWYDNLSAPVSKMTESKIFELEKAAAQSYHELVKHSMKVFAGGKFGSMKQAIEKYSERTMRGLAQHAGTLGITDAETAYSKVYVNLKEFAKVLGVTDETILQNKTFYTYAFKYPGHSGLKLVAVSPHPNVRVGTMAVTADLIGSLAADFDGDYTRIMLHSIFEEIGESTKKGYKSVPRRIWEEGYGKRAKDFAEQYREVITEENARKIGWFVKDGKSKIQNFMENMFSAFGRNIELSMREEANKELRRMGIGVAWKTTEAMKQNADWVLRNLDFFEDQIRKYSNIQEIIDRTIWGTFELLESSEKASALEKAMLVAQKAFGQMTEAVIRSGKRGENMWNEIKAALESGTTGEIKNIIKAAKEEGLFKLSELGIILRKEENVLNIPYKEINDRVYEIVEESIRLHQEMFRGGTDLVKRSVAHRVMNQMKNREVSYADFADLLIGDVGPYSAVLRDIGFDFENKMDEEVIGAILKQTKEKDVTRIVDMLENLKTGSRVDIPLPRPLERVEGFKNMLSRYDIASPLKAIGIASTFYAAKKIFGEPPIALDNMTTKDKPPAGQIRNKLWEDWPRDRTLRFDEKMRPVYQKQTYNLDVNTEEELNTDVYQKVINEGLKQVIDVPVEVYNTIRGGNRKVPNYLVIEKYKKFENLL